MFEFFRKSRKQKLHFLHIGKTGGSAIKSVLKNYLETSEYLLTLHGHGTSLMDIPKGELIVFFLRDPVSRFVSGFYSRQRKGQPRYYSDWSQQEKDVFEAFHTPNQLACSLSNELSKKHTLAQNAMNDVKHLGHYHDWYGDMDYFESRLDDILYIGFQESLNSDFTELKRILRLPNSVSLPDNDVIAHRNPDALDRTIDESNLGALNSWYSEDIKFVFLCKEIMTGRAHSHFSVV